MKHQEKKQTYPDLPDTAKNVMPKKEALQLMPRDLVEEFNAYVFEKSNDGIRVAALDPDLASLQSFAKERFGVNISWYAAHKEDMDFVLKNYARDFRVEISRLISGNREVNGNIVEVIDRIIRYALAEKASDMHIEPLRQETSVRFRIDGVLQKVLSLPPAIHPAIVARLKILANLKIDEYRRPQDGRIELENPPDTSLRISTVPTLYGEKIALRILDDSHKTLSIRTLGFSETHEHILLRNIEKPFGMIVTSGPTGSGKTTTLYGLLSLLKKDGINISTLEDPVEFALSGVNQIQINPRVDLSFASGLRTLLRQDPDVIMVGEIRDSETAVMATNAALTGHLVLTTLHTNDAPSAFTRFLEMRVEDFVVGSVVNLVIAQRLVRRICVKCAADQKLDEAILQKIRERADLVEILQAMGKDMAEIGKLNFARGAGCDACLQTGYQGRIGMFELLELNKEIHDLILAHASAERIRAAAVKTGFRDMIVDGAKKVFSGATTFDEVLRTTRNA